MVTNVANIQEKVIFYLTGNKKYTCFVRAPNIVERE